MSRLPKTLITTALLALATGAAGCSIPLALDYEDARNQCTSNDECPDNSVCTEVAGDLACVATETNLGSLVFEVRPTADINGNTVSHVFANSLSLSGIYGSGIVETIDLTIPNKVTFSGSISSGEPKEGCTGVDGSVPVQVELHAVSPYANMSNTYDVSSEVDENGNHRYSIDVPAGIYDVYVRPADLPEECSEKSIAPRLVPQVDVTTNVDFTVGVDQPGHVYGSIVVPEGKSLAGWHLEVVDAKYGLVISDAAILTDPVMPTGVIPILGGPKGDDPQGLRYYYTGKPIIRLRDAASNLVVHWTLEGVDLDGDGQVQLNLGDLTAETVHLEGNVVDEAANGVSASVTIESDKLTGTNNENASYKVVTETDATGAFAVDLVPGTYSVAVSAKSDLDLASASETDWKITKDNLGHGKTFVLRQRPILTGGVETALGDPVGNVPLVVSASDPAVKSYLSSTFAKDEGALPREANTTTSTLGSFNFPIDPGTVDFSVQPAAESLFPWIVVPRLLVGSSEANPVLDLGSLRMQAPVIVNGVVRTSEGVVPLALVRVLLPLPAVGGSPDMPTSVVEIGEVVTDENGRFTVPLPPSTFTILP